MSVYDQYETVIGLEIHVQLNTNSKAFCTDDASFTDDPNTHISIVSLGHPGTLPRANKKQVESAVKLGLALGCTINKNSRFDRKNYFYADLPKGYQITQDAEPICLGGQVTIEVDGKEKQIRLHHIHMEEDAGKSIHDQDPDHSMIDLNRAGVPLLEIVSEPDLRSPEEVQALMSTIRRLVRYLGISDGNMEEGSVRADCNVSVRKWGVDEYGTRCEIKNVNSMRFAKKAVAYEAKRQVDLVERGGTVIQSTLDFNPETGVTTPLRTKEDAHDYRYFPDPDLPLIVLTDADIASIQAQMPELPSVLIPRFIAMGLTEYDAKVLTEDRKTVDYFKEIVQHTKHSKQAANWLLNTVKSWLNEQNKTIAAFPIAPKQLAAVIELVASNTVSAAAASQQLFPAMVKEPETNVQSLAKRLNLIQESDASNLEAFVDQAIAKFPDKVNAYQKGKKGLIGLFMGEVMRLSDGKANPKVANQLLRKKLEV